MKTIAFCFFTAAVLMGMYSCVCHPPCNMPDREVTVDLKGFTDSTVEPVVMQSFAKGSGFTIYRDSTVITEISFDGSDGYFRFIANDTSDYIVKVGKTATGVYSYRLTDINLIADECKSCGKRFVLHTLKSYRVDGAPFTNTISGTPLVIQK